MTPDFYYPGLEYAAYDLSAFIFVLNVFIISRKDGAIVHFTPDNADSFKNWLIAHGIRAVGSRGNTDTK